MSASIEFMVNANLAAFKRAMREADQDVNNLVNNTRRKASQAQGGLTGMFRRTPERRAERAIAGLGTALMTGDPATGIMAFTEKLSGLGLAAGIGVGAAVGYLIKAQAAAK